MRDVILFNKALADLLVPEDKFVRCNKAGIISFHRMCSYDRVEVSKSVFSGNLSLTPNPIMMACFRTARYKLVLIIPEISEEGKSALYPVFKATRLTNEIKMFEKFDFPVMTVKLDRSAPSFVPVMPVPKILLKGAVA